MIEKINEKIFICRVVKVLGCCVIAFCLLLALLCVAVASEHGEMTASVFVFVAIISCGFLLLSEYLENLFIERKKRIVRNKRRMQTSLRVTFMRP